MENEPVTFEAGFFDDLASGLWGGVEREGGRDGLGLRLTMDISVLMVRGEKIERLALLGGLEQGEGVFPDVVGVELEALPEQTVNTGEVAEGVAGFVRDAFGNSREAVVGANGDIRCLGRWVCGRHGGPSVPLFRLEVG